jgi:hypothetical protein
MYAKRVFYMLLSTSHFTDQRYKNLAAKMMQIDAMIARNANHGLVPALAVVSRFSDGVCSLDSPMGWWAALQLAYTETARETPNAAA